MNSPNTWANKPIFRDFYKKLAPQTPTHFITINLAPPQCRMAPKVYNRVTEAQRVGLPPQIMNRFDREMYGSHHARRSNEEKFPFMLILETKNKRSRDVFCHYHIVVDMNNLSSRFIIKWHDILPKVEKVVEKFMGNPPNVDIRTCDPTILDYLLKNSVFDHQTIITRDNQ